MADIVKRLRQRDEYDRIVVLDHLNRPYGLAKSLEHEAADEIERLREALRIYASPSNWSVDGTFFAPSTQSEYRPACGDIARAALGEDRND